MTDSETLSRADLFDAAYCAFNALENTLTLESSDPDFPDEDKPDFDARERAYNRRLDAMSLEQRLIYELSHVRSADLKYLMTICQCLNDLCLNEVEKRGELTFKDDIPIVPYGADHFVETVLTRRTS